jgi:hypothetical protein
MIICGPNEKVAARDQSLFTVSVRCFGLVIDWQSVQRLKRMGENRLVCRLRNSTEESFAA